ncbi:hypothetical protein [Ilumatobacter coccineus]|uniref:Uncharacterized protein n=1 Tax=Ilumatobacter coccineus (strain NBRC 103263 / KCTC 29153 / YM16-304) TaxID=1313172 RepID=A0A6C7EIP6_ILUCY|nr:hypothetical protein [Ilumatobacter coccineus]BAN04408.1 hypothetical protein YM304_40940 [Ilumatobacter coccineus YM16-304]
MDGISGGESGGGEQFLEAQTLGSKNELAALLSDWMAGPAAPTIGDIEGFGRRPLLRIDLGGGHTAVLNADTKREAVVEYLRAVAERGADHDWQVVSNARGRFNKVVFTTDGTATPGWYCYLIDEVRSAQVV